MLPRTWLGSWGDAEERVNGRRSENYFILLYSKVGARLGRKLGEDHCICIYSERSVTCKGKVNGKVVMYTWEISICLLCKGLHSFFHLDGPFAIS